MKFGHRYAVAKDRLNDAVEDSIVGRYFCLVERKSTFTQEIAAGTVTFLTLAYILAVNASIISDTGGPCNSNDCTGPEKGEFDCRFHNNPGYEACVVQVKRSLVTATAAGSLVACVLMGLGANMPVALAPGMGLNAYFSTQVVGYRGTGPVSYQTALAAVFVEGWIFVFLAVTGIRLKLIRMVPRSIMLATSAGIGLFLAFIGLQSAEGLGMVVADSSTLVTLGGCPAQQRAPIYVIPQNSSVCSLDANGVIVQSLPPTGGNHACMGHKMQSGSVWLGLSGLILIGILMSRSVKGSIMCGILFVTIVAWIPNTKASYLGANTSIPGGEARLAYFKHVVDVPNLSKTGAAISFAGFTNGQLWIALITFLYVDFLDATGTLFSMANFINNFIPGFLDENKSFPNQTFAFCVDGLSSVIGSLMGTSPITAFVESASGIREGGRTGITALTVGFYFFISLFFTPIFASIPPYAVGPALITVGALMMINCVRIKWDKSSEALPAFLTILIIPMTYSIAYGVIAGIGTYTIINLFNWVVDQVIDWYQRQREASEEGSEEGSVASGSGDSHNSSVHTNKFVNFVMRAGSGFFGGRRWGQPEDEPAAENKDLHQESSSTADGAEDDAEAPRLSNGDLQHSSHPADNQAKQYFARLCKHIAPDLEVRLDAGEGKGKGVFAKREFEKDELLFKEPPLVGGQDTANKAQALVCSHCFCFLGSIELQVAWRLLSDKYKGGHAPDPELLQELEASTSRLPHTHLFKLPAPVACRGGCSDEVFCSQRCADAAWASYHSLLCCGPQDELPGTSSGPPARFIRTSFDMPPAQRSTQAASGDAQASGSGRQPSPPKAAPSDKGKGKRLHTSSGRSLLDTASLAPSARRDPDALRQFRGHADATNSAFHIAAKVVASTLIAARQRLDHLSLTDFEDEEELCWAALLQAWEPFGMGWKRIWWEAIEKPPDVADEAGFRADVKELAADSLELLSAALYDSRFEPLFSLDVYGSIVGMFELNNLGIWVASPVQDYFLHIDALEGAERAAVHEAAGPLLEALDSSYDAPCEGTAYYALQSCMNHSCAPNCHAMKSAEDVDGSAVLLAKRRVHRGEEVTISYIEEDMTYKERCHALKDYGFRSAETGQHQQRGISHPGRGCVRLLSPLSPLFGRCNLTMSKSLVLSALLLCLALAAQQAACYGDGEIRCSAGSPCPTPVANPYSCLVPVAGSCIVSEDDGECSASSFRPAGPRKACKDASGQASCCGDRTGSCLSASEVSAPCAGGPGNQFCQGKPDGTTCPPNGGTGQCAGGFCNTGLGGTGRKFL
ncbi:hypothetical protein WJX72_011125 [[Myrmecia] bisecta]|uniref:SET domain-containing protein n=1 Tax=[Myrmecia] bisecta TaxID=41462 RepID=A0AAW1PTV9_9CHLO